MSVIAAIVPCGPNYVERGRRLIGYVGCPQCDHVMTVRATKGDQLQAFCLKTDGGCGCQIDLPRGVAMPVTAVSDLNRCADDIAEFPAQYREHLARSWVLTTEQLEAITRGKKIPEVIPEEPVEKPGEAERTETGEAEHNPGNPGGTAERTGTRPGDPGSEPVDPEPTGRAEPGDGAGDGSCGDEFFKLVGGR